MSTTKSSKTRELLVVVVLLTFLLLYLASRQFTDQQREEEWERFTVDHHCQLLRDFAPHSDPYRNRATGEILSRYIPGHRTYLCDGGVVYERDYN